MLPGVFAGMGVVSGNRTKGAGGLRVVPGWSAYMLTGSDEMVLQVRS